MINATGVVLHTNLGRAVLSALAQERLLDVAGARAVLRPRRQVGAEQPRPLRARHRVAEAQAGQGIDLRQAADHHEVRQPTQQGLFDLSGVDPRWIQIIRPTVIAGGELTMEELEVKQNAATKICEAPLRSEM